MKIKTLLILFFCIVSYSNWGQNNQINWMTWDEMVAQREKDSVKKKVFIDLYTGWCGWCKKMDKTTFTDPTIVQYMNKNYYPVKFDAETRDTIEFNGMQFVNSDPNFVKQRPNARGRTHWFAHSLLDGKLSYPSYVILDENFTRLMILQGYKTQEALLGNLIFFAKDEYKYYHNFLNNQWNTMLKKQQEAQKGK